MLPSDRPPALVARIGLEALINAIQVAVYGIFYAIGNAIFLRRFRRSPYREIKMDFCDRFMAPLALFYTAEDLRRMAGSGVEFVFEGTYPWGIMLGMVFCKRPAE